MKRKIINIIIIINLLICVGLPWFFPIDIGIKIPWSLGWFVAFVAYRMLVFIENINNELRATIKLLMKRNESYIKTLDAMAQRDVKK